MSFNYADRHSSVTVHGATDTFFLMIRKSVQCAHLYVLLMYSGATPGENSIRGGKKTILMKSNLNSVALGGSYERYILSFKLEDLFSPARKMYCM